ncbi:MAG: hypothetical protein CMB80_03230 [Flammeovirgaceae bacterium]|jgi:hypothetical protein|nr:hypothetical protein [Flammeovirgaceae bacterium]|tara:strand:- start:542 stop:817 length:276 start_codon:yes stop_codon:yes gene_type:complete
MANYKKGQTNNPNGRPRISLAEELRRNPKIKKVINQVIETAESLGTKKEHPQAVACAKILMDKSLPNLKASEIQVEGNIQLPVINIKLKES